MPTLVDVDTAEDTGSVCDFCADPIERGDTVAVLAEGVRLHHDGCYQAALDDAAYLR